MKPVMMFPAPFPSRKNWQPKPPQQTAFVIGKNLKTGEMYAHEYGRHNHLNGQISVDEMDVDPDTGEIIEEQPKASGNVIDLRKAMNG